MELGQQTWWTWRIDKVVELCVIGRGGSPPGRWRPQQKQQTIRVYFYQSQDRELTFGTWAVFVYCRALAPRAAKLVWMRVRGADGAPKLDLGVLEVPVVVLAGDVFILPGGQTSQRLSTTGVFPPTGKKASHHTALQQAPH